MTIILNVLKALALSLLTEAVAKKLIILLLDRAAKSTDNTVDDEVIKIVKDALKV